MVRDFSLTLLPEPGSAERSKYMFTNAPPVSHIGTVDSWDPSATMVDEAEIDGTSDAVSSHLAEAASTAPPQAPTPFQPTTSLSSLGDVIRGPALPHGSEAARFASPRENSEPLQFTESITNNPELVSSEVLQFPSPTRSLILAHSPVLDSHEVAMLDQAAVVLGPTLDVPSQISPAITLHQPLISPTTTQVSHLVSAPLAPDLSSATALRQVLSVAHDPTAASDSQVPQAAQVVDAGSSSLAGPAEATSSHYKTRGPGKTIGQSRRDSIEGAPDVILTLGGSGYELSGQPDTPTALPTATSSTSTPTTPLDDLIVPSSQQSLKEVLTIPPGTDAVINKSSGISRFAPRVIPEFDHNLSDFPSWLHDRGRLNAVLEVEAGDLWKKLIGLWLQQGRRLAYGLNNKIVS